MKRRVIFWTMLVAAAWLAGCATRTVVVPVSPATAVPPVTEVPAGPGTLLVESEPSGATVVANNQPVGHTPLRLSVAATPQGFFRDYLAVKVRFVAKDAGEVSRTVEEDFTPREKVPARVLVTIEGVKRVMR
jgi:hypothetical protein